jgi:hypothetical protein
MESGPLVNPVEPQVSSPASAQPAKFFLAVIVVLAGVVAGYFLSKSSVGKAVNSNGVTNTMVQTKNEVGSTDASFKDTATGELQEGGIRGEGTHKLIRDGGPSQTVYLVSSVIDLESYAGKKVQVWGQTLKAKYAGWLMDVGRLKILE